MSGYDDDDDDDRDELDPPPITDDELDELASQADGLDWRAVADDLVRQEAEAARTSFRDPLTSPEVGEEDR
jgi:hypothetical protein